MSWTIDEEQEFEHTSIDTLLMENHIKQYISLKYLK